MTNQPSVGQTEAVLDRPSGIMESAPDGILGWDINGTITYWNKGAEKLYGYSAGEIVGKNAEVLVPPERRGDIADILRRIRSGEEWLRHEAERIDKAGRRLRVLVTHVPVRDVAGRLIGVSVIVHDVSELKRAQEDLQAAVHYTRSLLEASLDPLATIGPDGKITDANEAAVQATGIARNKLVGTDFAACFTDPAAATAGYRKVFANGFVRDYPLTIRHRSGSTMDVLYNASLYRDLKGNAVGAFAAARDVTALKRAEDELQKHRVHLEETVRSRTAELNAANEKLEFANKELETFAYSVSHDLRAPLRAIDGFSNILLEEHAAKLDAEAQRLLNVVRDNAKKMNELIDGILEFSRAGRVELQQQSVDMAALAGAVIADLRAAGAGKVQFKIGALPRAQGDEAMLRRVWTNLLDNAVKFSAPKPDAMIEVGATASAGEAVYFVRDNGVGFDMTYVGKIFEAFQRLHGAEFAGTGIGLAIVKRIVARHGGHVWAQGRPDEGATLYFSLPTREETHV